MKTIFMALAVVAMLTACGEKPQANSAGKHDVAPYGGTGKAFVDSGWKESDKLSWQSHLKARTQYGQNDHGRTN